MRVWSKGLVRAHFERIFYVYIGWLLRYVLPNLNYNNNLVPLQSRKNESLMGKKNLNLSVNTAAGGRGDDYW